MKRLEDCECCMRACHTRVAKCWRRCSCNARAGRKRGGPPAIPCAHPKPPPLGLPAYTQLASVVRGAVSGGCRDSWVARASAGVCVCPVIRHEPLRDQVGLVHHLSTRRVVCDVVCGWRPRLGLGLAPRAPPAPSGRLAPRRAARALGHQLLAQSLSSPQHAAGAQSSILYRQKLTES